MYRAAMPACALAAVVLAGCASVPEPIGQPSDLGALAADEERLWAMSAEVDTALARSGAVHSDRDLQAYLQGIVDRLFPEFDGHINVQVTKNAEANAFAMANGSVYINTGMLARLRNEAELAAVLGHEGAHFTERHVVESMRSAKSLSMLASIVGAATGYGGALASSIVLASSMSSISQANERDADVIGMQRMASAGYDADQPAGPFLRLAQELEVRDIDQPLMFRSHPRLRDRAASLATLADGRGNGETGVERYLANTGAARVAALEQAAERQEGELLVFLLEDDAQRATYAGAGEYYLAEGYRLRGGEGDTARAEAFYRQAIVRQPDSAPAWGKLGYLYMKAGDKDRAIEHFEKFEELDLGSKDSAYIEAYLRQLKGEGGP